MDEKEVIVKSEDGEDRVSKTKTIYDAGAGDIFKYCLAQTHAFNN